MSPIQTCIYPIEYFCNSAAINRVKLTDIYFLTKKIIIS